MTTTRWSTLLAVAVVTFALAWTGLRTAREFGWSQPAPPWPVVGVLVLLAVGVLSAAWPIRQWTSGRRTRAINPLRAARTVALAKAASLTGAVVTGLWGAFGAQVLPGMDVPGQPERAVLTGGAILVSVGLAVAGMVAERWCRIPPEEHDDEGSARRAPNGSAA